MQKSHSRLIDLFVILFVGILLIGGAVAQPIQEKKNAEPVGVKAVEGDIYEDDDIYTQANLIPTNGTPQTHTFYPAGDDDFVKFQAVAGSYYLIETFNNTDIDITDTELTLYDTNGTAQLVYNDDIVLGVIRTSRILWNCSSSGTYYVNISEFYNSENGSYNISVKKIGRLVPYLVDPITDVNVSQYEFFNFTSGVRCEEGICDSIKAILDPKQSSPVVHPRITKSKNRNKVESKVLEEFNVKSEVPVIVILKDVNAVSKKSYGIGSLETKKITKKEALLQKKVTIKGQQNKVLSSLEGSDFKPKHRYNTITALSGRLTKRGLEKLKDNPDVERIYFDKSVRVLLDVSVPLINADDVWLKQFNGMNITGKGETIAVIDTGVNYNHPDLGGGWGVKVIGGYDFVNDDVYPLDDHGHGSHVAGIIASNDSTYKGVAPDSNIVAIKVLDADGWGVTSDVIAGIDWSIDNSEQFNISVISMSLGDNSSHNAPCDDSPETSSINRAVEQGIFVAVASGNDNYGYGTTPPGISSPACISNATSVGATTDSDTIASLTNRGQILDLLAPGSTIIATDYAGTHTSMSGTSMATPHVSGVAALLQQYFKKRYNRTLSPDEIKHALKYNGVSITDTGGTGLTFPRVDALAAVEAKGIVPTLVGAKPFYTISTNPHNATCLDHLNEGESCNQTWIINATGQAESTWEFFSIYESSYTDNNNTYNTHNVTSKVNITILDLTPPTISIISPQNTSYPIASQVINSTVTDASSVDSVIAEINALVNVSLGKDGFTDYYNSTYTFSEGQNFIRIYANDTAGNINNTETIYFTVDTKPPSIILTSPQNKTYTTNNISLNVSANEPISTWLYSLDGSANLTFEPNITLTGLSDGHHNITVWANDTAGNSNMTGARTLTIDTIDPVVNFVDPTDPDGSLVNRNWTYINVSIVESQAIDSVILDWNGINESINVLSNTAYVNKTNNDGTISYRVYVNDSAGNLGVSETRSITIDTTVTLQNSTSENSTLSNGSVLQNSSIVDAIVIGSNISDGSNVIDSNLTNSIVTNSLIQNTSIVNATVIDANITDGYIEKMPNKTASIVLLKGDVRINFSNIYKKVKIDDLIVNTSKNTTSITPTEASANITKTVINDSSIGIIIDIHPNASISSLVLQVAETTLNPEENGSETTLTNMIGNYIQIQSQNINSSNTKNITIKLKVPSGYGTISINYYNATSDSWIPQNTIVSNGYAVANVSHFSTYALSGTETVQSQSISSSGGGGGGGSPSPIKLISAGATEMTSTTYSNILITLSAGGKINKDRFVETSDTLAGSLLLTKKYPLPTDLTVAQFARTVETVTGDVYALAAEASEDISFKYGALENKLVIARGDLGVDSMVAVAYAKAKNIPILLVKPNELPSVTENAISNMMAIRKREIIIVGGPVAVSNTVEMKLKEIGDVKRIYGETRIETAVALAEEAFTDKNKVRVIVITDYENPKIDAVLMSYVLDAPLLYVKSNSLSPIVKDYILEHKETIFGHTKIVLMGVDPKIAPEINGLLK